MRSRTSSVWEALQPAALFKVDIDGAIVEPPTPEESPLRRYMSLSRREPRFNALLNYVGKRDSWTAIYQACDEAESICDGEHKLLGLLGGQASIYKNVTRTANYYHRHGGKRKGKPPPHPTSLIEAQQVLSIVVDTAFRYLAKDH
jgi:hypothetical protein